jgi:hypothetical protein
MRNRYDEEDEHDYSPNELANLSISNKEKADRIISSNLEEGDTVEKWEQRNLERAQQYLRNKK